MSMRFSSPFIQLAVISALTLSLTSKAISNEERMRALAAPSRSLSSSSSSSKASSSSSSMAQKSSSSNSTQQSSQTNQTNPYATMGQTFAADMKKMTDSFLTTMSKTPTEDKSDTFLKDLLKSKPAVDNSFVQTLSQSIIQSIQELAKQQMALAQEKFTQEMALKQKLDSKEMEVDTSIPSSPMIAITDPTNNSHQSNAQSNSMGLFSNQIESLTKKAYNPPR